MSSFAWIIVGFFIICPHNEAAETEKVCTCQQSGLGSFGLTSHSSHHSGHGTFGHSGSSTETLVQNGPFGLGHYVTHAISSAAEAADSILSPSGYNKGELESFGNSGSSSHQQVSITYGQSGQTKSLGQFGTRLFGPLEASSGNSQSSDSMGSGHYVTYTTSSTAHATGASDTIPFSNGPDGGEPDPLGTGLFGHLGSSSHQLVPIALGQSGQSKSLGQGLGQYISYNNSGATATAETADTGLSTNGSEQSPIEPESFGHAVSNSNQQDSITFGQSGQSKSFGQELAHYVLYNNSIATAQTNPSQFETGEGGSVASGSVLYGQSTPSSEQHVTVSVGLSGASSIQNGTRLFGPSEESSGSSASSESFGSGHYGTYTTSSTEQTAEAAGTRPSPDGPDGVRPVKLETGSFGLSGSNSHQETATIFGKPGQNKSSNVGGEYIQYNSVADPVTGATEKKLSTMGGEPVPPGSRPFIESEPSSYQHLTVSDGISDVTLDQPQLGPVVSSGSSSAEHGIRLLRPSKVSSEISTSSESFVSGPYLKYTTSSTVQTSKEPEAKPFPNGSNEGVSSQLGSGPFEPSGSNSIQQVSVTYGQQGQSQSLGQGLGQYISYNKSLAAGLAEAEDAKPSQFGKEKEGSILPGSVSFGQSESSSAPQVTVSLGISGTSSNQPGQEPLGTAGDSSNKHEDKIFEPSEANSGSSIQSGSIGSGHYVKYTTSSIEQVPEGTETRPFLNRPDGEGPGLLGLSGSHQNMSVTFVQSGQSQSLGTGLGQGIQYSKSISTAAVDAAETKPSGAVVGLHIGESVPSAISLFEQSGSSLGHSGTRLFEEHSGANSGTSSSTGSPESGNYLKHATSSVVQMAEEPEIGPPPTGPGLGGPSPFPPGPFGQSVSGSNQQVSLTFGQLGQTKSLEKDLGQYNEYSNSVAAEKKPYQFGSDEEAAVSSGSIAFGQPVPNSYEQISGSAGQYTIGSDQPEHYPIESSGSSLGQSGTRLFEEHSGANSGTSSSTGSLGSGNYLKHATSSAVQMAEEPEIGPSPTGPGLGGPSPFPPGPFGQSVSGSDQQVSLTFGQLGQTKTLGKGLGQYNQYSNSVAAQTKPYQFGSDGEVAVSSGSVAFGQPVPNSYQQISGSVGQYIIGSGQPERGSVGSSGSSLGQSGTRLFGEHPGANSGTSSTGSLISGNYLKHAISSVGQMAEEPEVGPSPTEADLGGSGQFASGPFEQSGSISSPYISVTSGQLGQGKSFGDPGLYNQYTNSVATKTKPSQFVSDGGVTVSPGSVSFSQPGISSYQQISGSFGSYAPISDQPGHGSAGLLEFSSVHPSAGLLGSSEPSSETSTKDGSLGSGHYKTLTTSSISQTAGTAEARPYLSALYEGRPGLSGPGPFKYSGYSSNQQVSATSGLSDQSKSPGQGLGNYTPDSNSVEEAAAAETKPAEFGLLGGGSVSSIPFGQPRPSSYQQIPGFFIPSDDSSNPQGSRPFGMLGSNTEQYVAGTIGTFTGSSDQPGHNPIGSPDPLSVQPGAELFGPSDASPGTYISSGSFGSGHYETLVTSPAAEETGPSPIRPGGGGQFEHSGYSPQQHVSVTFGQSGLVKSSEKGLGQYIPFDNSVSAAAAEATETKPSQFESNGDGNVPSGSVPFWQQRPSPDQRLPGSVGPLRPILNQPGDGVFGPSEASLGKSTSLGSFGSGNYMKYSTSTAAQTAEAGSSPKKPDVGALGSFEHSGIGSHQHVYLNFDQSGNIKSSSGQGQFIPSGYSATEAMAVAEETKPSPYGPYTETLATSELMPSGPSENNLNQPDHVSFETTSTSPGSGSQGSNTGLFEPDESIGSGPYAQYTITSTPSMAGEADTKPLTFINYGERPDSTGLTSFRPSEYGSYKPVFVPFNSYGPSADYPDADSFGLSSSLLYQPVRGLHETSQQSTEASGTNELLGQGSYAPYTISSETEIGTTGRPKTGLFGLSGSNTIISVPNEPFGLRPGLYVPYRKAEGASMAAKAQAEPSPYEPHKGEGYPSESSSEQLALSFNGQSTPTSYEPSTGQSTVVSESSGHLGPGLYNSHTPLEATTVVAVSPTDKKAILKSASRLSSLLTTARVSTATAFFLPSGRFNSSSLSKVISYLIKSISESLPGLSGNEMLLQVLLELIASLMHILASASIGQVGTCPSSSSSLVGQSLTHALGS